MTPRERIWMIPRMGPPRRRFRRRQMVGQYRIEGLIASGASAEVYKAYDTELGIRVALKIPLDHLEPEMLESIRDEVRLVARLEHRNIVSVRTSSEIDGRLVIVQPLGVESLADRLARRLARRQVIKIGREILEGLAYAHKRRIVHCDVKPENVILFEDGTTRLSDFGLARVAERSLDASGSGTVGYMAPEQALGRPSLRSDVFSVGLILYRMMSGELPTWPFDWPFPGHDRAKRNYHRDMLALVRKATQVDSRRRFANAEAMLQEYRRIEDRAVLARRSN